MKKDYYEILGIARESAPEEIKKAYRDVALKYHPDRNPGDKEAEENFKKASEAYEVLSDPEKKSLYDRFGEAGLSGTGFHPFNDVEDIFSSFGDVFQDFFGFGPSRKPHGRTRRGRDLSVEEEISFEEACFGVEKNTEIAKQERCATCNGSGAKSGQGRTTCSYCRGAGQVSRSQGFFTVTTTCPQCRGNGSMITDPCSECRGQGRMLKKKKLNFKIPPGVDDGTRLILQGEGEAGAEGGEPGDLYVLIQVRSHEKFVRDGSNIYSEESIPFVTAALGGEVQVSTLEGVSVVRVPKGSDTGDTVIIEGIGAPHLKSKKRGDHIVKLIVKTPKRLTKKQEELLREFAALSDESVAPPKKKKGIFS